MKILMVIDSLGIGGKERRMIELIKGLLQKGDYTIEVVILSDVIYYQSILSLNIKIYSLVRKIKKDPLILIKLYRICLDFKPDIIHSWELMATTYSAVISKLLHIKLVNSMIANAPVKLSFKESFLSKIVFCLSNFILANSYAGLQSFKAPIKKSRCIHNGFDFDRIMNITNKDEILKKLNIQTDKIVGMVGEMAKRKDYKTYLFAAMEILRERQDVTFLAVGGGPDYSQNSRLVGEKFKNRILFTGDQKDVESIVNVFDIGVLTTDNSVHGEGISNSILEYMALSKPVIATESGGTKEIVDNNLTGFLIETYSIIELKERINYLLENSDEAKAMGERGYRRIKEEFSIEKMISSFEDIYKLVLN